MTSSRAKPPTSAAGRLLAVLHAFAPGRTSLSLTEISRRAGLTLTTAHRLAGELVAWGALERDSEGRYRIGIWVLELAALSPRGLELRENALPFLEDLLEATHGNVHLSIRDNLEVVYVETLRPRGAVEVFSRLGGRWPMHAVGTGLVLLAHADAEVQERVLQAPLQRFTEKTVTDPHVLRRVLADVRRTGVAVATGQITLDALAVAAPVRGPDDEVIASIGVVKEVTTSARALAPAVTASARALSRALGAPSARSRVPQPVGTVVRRRAGDLPLHARSGS
ncbi:MAG: helix-turn-helix domain-containing protein [Pseudonocardiaceae bacterium]|nr:helix-turn-helix domain-containing protein [Pseudonocardiaceae bacterium]